MSDRLDRINEIRKSRGLKPLTESNIENVVNEVLKKEKSPFEEAIEEENNKPKSTKKKKSTKKEEVVTETTEEINTDNLFTENEEKTESKPLNKEEEKVEEKPEEEILTEE